MKDTFKTIARYEYSSEAQIIKGRLEADGIQVFLTDNLTIDTDPLVSNAIGGVKLKVLSEDASKAEDILRSIQKYSMDEEGNFVKCPECQSEHVQVFSTIKDFRSFFAFFFGFLFGTLPFYAKHKYRCDDCKTEFDIK